MHKNAGEDQDACLLKVIYVDVATRPDTRNLEVINGTDKIHLLVFVPNHGKLRVLYNALEHIGVLGHFC